MELNRQVLQPKISTFSINVTMTTVKAARQMPQAGNDVTVEQYLTTQCESMISDVRKHGQATIEKFRAEYKQNYDQIMQLLQQQATEQHEKICVALKCITGAHLGQKFRLEPATANGDDVFKLGRSTGRQFKEKGVSLYKDKEISTTHARIEIKGGDVFLVDMGSTNGTQINSGPDLEHHVPYRLVEGDVICLGSTEMIVNIRPLDDTPGGSENSTLL